MIRRILALGLALAVTSARGYGQGAAVTTPPPPIVFAPWQEVARTDLGVEYLVTFPSPFVSAYPANNSVPLRVFLPAIANPAPVVLVLHYWGATDLRLERVLAEELNRRGIAAAILTLPYHLSRTPPGHRSGELAVQPDPDSLKATMIQSVWDSRRALDFLVTRPELRGDQVGVAGTSLGALVTGLVAAIDPRIAHASFLLGGVDLAHILWSSSRVVPQRDVLRRRGVTEDRLRATLADIEPLTYLEKHRPASSFVIGGLFDTVIPRSSTEALIKVLDTRNVLWLDTGHYGGIFVQRRLMREVARYFGTSFTSADFVPPKKLYAPTVRLGFKVDTARGLDLGIGLDLYKFDRRGDGYATLFLTPRGPELFAGRRIAQGLSIGFVGSPRGLGGAILWSTVL
ncbi:alpha/beta hydrolase family protein [Fimbriimonas ginsengisoli]|uniref:Abhydrolase domain-containing 18 n=1 Tax=Fimbriimonas ginsengisoli Gsoil 348 TaxID=661478 RepID=A0A068NN80_FIMGI|nr:alpha/beta hydrolase [Fimbriimonas ginsengisoli]AIE84857.1 hypothetical protein OP10G_1489 [Fimbriimonas ginsengisoli Gsoil 348]